MALREKTTTVIFATAQVPPVNETQGHKLYIHKYTPAHPHIYNQKYDFCYL